MTEWQVIDTAPAGKRLLVYPHSNGESVVAFKNHYGKWLTIPGRYTFRPTHWMPLPDPPALGEETR